MNLNSVLLIVLLSLFSYGQYLQNKADSIMISQLTNINKNLGDCNFKLNTIISNNDNNDNELNELDIKFNESGVNVQY